MPEAYTRRVLVVDANSASPQLPGVTYYGVEATHAQMCKFSSSNAPGYRALSTDIRQWVMDAPDIIDVRWQVEEQERAARMRHEIHERMSPYVSQLMASTAAGAAGVAGARPAPSMPCAPRAARHRHQQHARVGRIAILMG